MLSSIVVSSLAFAYAAYIQAAFASPLLNSLVPKVEEPQVEPSLVTRSDLPVCGGDYGPVDQVVTIMKDLLAIQNEQHALAPCETHWLADKPDGMSVYVTNTANEAWGPTNGVLAGMIQTIIDHCTLPNGMVAGQYTIGGVVGAPAANEKISLKVTRSVGEIVQKVC